MMKNIPVELLLVDAMAVPVVPGSLNLLAGGPYCLSDTVLEGQKEKKS